MNENPTQMGDAESAAGEESGQAKTNAVLPSRQRFNRLILLALVLVGVLAVSAIAYFAFDVELLNGQLGVLTALGAVGLLLIGQFVRFRERISLRTLLIMVTVLAVGLAYVGRRLADSQAESDAVEALVAGGATVTYSTGDEPNSEYFQTENGWFLPNWIRDWLGASYFGNVERLRFDRWQLEDQDVQLLQDIRRLDSLNVRASNVTAEGVASMPLVPGITEMSIAWEQVAPESVARLADLPELKRLDIGFSNPAFGPNVKRPPSQFHALSELLNLEFLSAEVATINANDIKALAKMRSLRSIHLNSARTGQVTNPGGLAELGNSQTLRGIMISIRNFGDNELASFGRISSLQSVYLYSTSVTADGVRAFRAEHPHVDVRVTPPIPGLEDLPPRRRVPPDDNKGQLP